ncbi:hypothetical protein PU560_04950, partial [Georgenia sp. 10Sc9-8]|nr:hypothetical protein [Georgenia halotolerans]
MPADELVPPEAYSWWVPTVGALLLLAVAVWYAWVLWRTRRGGHGQPEQVPVPGTVRQHYEQEVEA